MPEGDEARRNDGFGVTHVHHFYTKRNLIVLAKIWSKLSTKAKWNLTNIISRNVTKHNRFVINAHNPRGRINGPMTGTLYIPSETVEQNVFELAGYKLINFDGEIQGNAICTQSATDYSNCAKNSFDYIFTDPPFGSNFMYSVCWKPLVAFSCKN